MDYYESSPHFSLIHHSSHISPDLIQESSSLDKAKWHASSCVQFFFLPIKNYRFSEGRRIFFFIMVITMAHIWFCFPRVFGATVTEAVTRGYRRCTQCLSPIYLLNSIYSGCGYLSSIVSNTPQTEHIYFS